MSTAKEMIEAVANGAGAQDVMSDFMNEAKGDWKKYKRLVRPKVPRGVSFRVEAPGRDSEMRVVMEAEYEDDDIGATMENYVTFDLYEEGGEYTWEYAYFLGDEEIILEPVDDSFSSIEDAIKWLNKDGFKEVSNELRYD